MQFLSTPSARRATSAARETVGENEISIHALCEEGDTPDQTPCSTSENFYPRPLRGGRRGGVRLKDPGGVFLSTPSARRATSKKEVTALDVIVFLSTPSARRATASALTIRP